MSAPVVVTTHAQERMRLRFPEFNAVTDGALQDHVRLEVEAALALGRCACRQPRWLLVREGSRRRRARRWKAGVLRFVWTHDEQRAFLVRRLTDRTVVITVFRRGDQVTV